jgi:RNA polymerase sigma-70 factor (ECF subfamily)
MWPRHQVLPPELNRQNLTNKIPKDDRSAAVIPVTIITVNLDDEPSLIDASRRGDPEAFASLVVRYQRMIHALTYRMSGSESDASDLAQETFVQAWRKLDEFRGEARFSSWLYRISVNLCLNWKARQAREAQTRSEWSDSAIGGGPHDGADPRVKFVQEALMRLSAKQRAAVVLTVYNGFKHEEAARLLGCSETTISWRVFAAKGKLKRWLQKMDRQENAGV